MYEKKTKHKKLVVCTLKSQQQSKKIKQFNFIENKQSSLRLIVNKQRKMYKS